METVGRLTNATKDFMTGKLNITFQIDTYSIDEINNLLRTSDVLDITAKKHKKKRSLDANAYFHVLVGKIADELRLSKTRCKNVLIARYGQQELLDDGTPVVMKTNIGVDKMLEQEFLHCFPCGCKEENGAEVVFYKVFRGSHTLDSKEFSILLEGTIQEAKDLGIETLPPEQLQQIISEWKGKNDNG